MNVILLCFHHYIYFNYLADILIYNYSPIVLYIIKSSNMNNSNNSLMQEYSNGNIDQLTQLMNEQAYSDIDSLLQNEELYMISKLKHPFVCKHPQETIFNHFNYMATLIEQLHDEDVVEPIKQALENNYKEMPINIHQKIDDLLCIDKTYELTIAADVII